MSAQNHIQVYFENIEEEQNDLLVALLNEAGFSGFEEGTGNLKAYVPEEKFDREELELILNTIPVNYSISIIPQQNWNAEWESRFEPVRIKDFAVVRARFHAKPEGVKHDIIITPKMSFGTGHHETTFLMMEQLSALKLQNKTVLDFGTGTGILAILSEKMGAAAVTAIDNDEWSIRNSEENILENGCTRVSLQLAGSVPANETYDVILANLTLNLILEKLYEIVAACRVGTTVLFSGFVKADEVILFKALALQGFVCTSITQKGDWICLGVTIK